MIERKWKSNELNTYVVGGGNRFNALQTLSLFNQYILYATSCVIFFFFIFIQWYSFSCVEHETLCSHFLLDFNDGIRLRNTIKSFFFGFWSFKIRWILYDYISMWIVFPWCKVLLFRYGWNVEMLKQKKRRSFSNRHVTKISKKNYLFLYSFNIKWLWNDDDLQEFWGAMRWLCMCEGKKMVFFLSVRLLVCIVYIPLFRLRNGEMQTQLFGFGPNSN